MKYTLFNKHTSVTKYTKRNRFTRQCIGEALITLMESKRFEFITISDVVRKAGVSRMTFYHYYRTKNDVLVNYLQELLYDYLTEFSQTIGLDQFLSHDHIYFTVNYFYAHHHTLDVMINAGMYQLIVHTANIYLSEYITSHTDLSDYTVYFYCGGFLNVLLKWEERHLQDSPEVIIEQLTQIFDTISVAQTNNK